MKIEDWRRGHGLTFDFGLGEMGESRIGNWRSYESRVEVDRGRQKNEHRRRSPRKLIVVDRDSFAI